MKIQHENLQVIRELALFQLAFETAGHEESLGAVVALCHRVQIPLPEWASVAVLEYLACGIGIDSDENPTMDDINFLLSGRST